MVTEAQAFVEGVRPVAALVLVWLTWLAVRC